jgi:RES domain-containing protein
MVVYRVAGKKHAFDLSGEGARLHGGRWNHEGTACLYTSESRALALLEYTVNVAADNIPLYLILLTLEVPESQFMQVKYEKLPKDWQESPHTVSTQNLGTLILNESDLNVIGVPSSVIPEEWNFLLNPKRMPQGWPIIVEAKEIMYDFRIKQ